MLNAQVQYRRSDNERINVFPTLGGHADSSSLSLPVSLNINHRRTMHTVSFTLSKNSSQTVNRYANVVDVAGNAGISGVATDPFDWGVPDLSFTSLSSLRDLDPSKRTDRRISTAYTWTRPIRLSADGPAATTGGMPPATAPTRTHAGRTYSRACTPRAAQRPRAATASTSPISCSDYRSRPACNTDRGASTCAADR